MSSKSRKKSSTLAIVVASESGLEAEPKRSEAELKMEFESLCKDAKSIQRETVNLVEKVQRNILALAKKLYEAKLVYEEWTGTGHGKRRSINGILPFHQEVAKRTNVSEKLVQKFCQIGKLAPEIAALIDGKKIAGNFTALLKVAQMQGLAGLEVVSEAVNAFDEGGRTAMDAVFDKAAPPQSEAKVPAVVVETPPSSEGMAPSSTPEVLAPEYETNDSDEDASSEEGGADDDGLDAEGDESNDEDESEDEDDRDALIVKVEPVPAVTGPSVAKAPSTATDEALPAVLEIPFPGMRGRGIVLGADAEFEVVRFEGRQCNLFLRITFTKQVSETAAAAE